MGHNTMFAMKSDRMRNVYNAACFRRGIGSVDGYRIGDGGGGGGWEFVSGRGREGWAGGYLSHVTD